MIYVRWTGCVVVALVGAAWIWLLLASEPTLHISAANGSYSNACCGTITLRDGLLTMGSLSPVHYTLREDKTGPYVLPDVLVGITDGRKLGIERGKIPLKLYLDSNLHPRAIQLIDAGQNIAHVFIRGKRAA